MSNMKLKVGQKLPRGMNINDVQVPPELRRRVPTGVPFVDFVFGGKGVTPSTCNMLTGVPGAGKSRMLMQVADSLTAQGHIVLYNSNEESAYQLAITCELMKLKHGFVIGADVLVKDMLDHARQLQKKLTGKKTKSGQPAQVFIICDSLATMDDGKYGNGHTNTNTPVRVAELITEWCKTKNSGQYGIAFLIGHVTKAGEFAGKQTIKHVIDSHLHMYLDKDAGSESFGMRMLCMEKNRFGAGVPPIVLSMAEDGLHEAEVYS